MSNFENPKVPLPGVASAAAFEIKVELDHGRRVATDPVSWSQQLDLAIVG